LQHKGKDYETKITIFYSEVHLSSCYRITFFPEFGLCKKTTTKTLNWATGGINIYIQPYPKYHTGTGQRDYISYDLQGKPINQDLYKMTFDDNLLYLLDNELIVNNYSYGSVSKDDKVEIIEKDVYINNKIAKGRLLSKEFRVSLSSPHYFSSARVGSHSIFVAPGSSTTFSDTEEFMGVYIYNYQIGDINVSISQDTLTVNDKSYGFLKENSIVIIEEGVVYINDETKIKEVDIDLITDL